MTLCPSLATVELERRECKDVSVPICMWVDFLSEVGLCPGLPGFLIGKGEYLFAFR